MPKRTKRTKRRSSMTPAQRAVKAARNAEAYQRAQQCSPRNAAIVLAALTARGVPIDQTEPGQNVLTVPAWNHLGRRVIRGQQGTPIPVFRKKTETDPKTGKDQVRAFWAVSRVFHVSQTVAFGEPDPETPPAIGPATDAEPAIERAKAELKAEQDQKAALTTQSGVRRLIDSACDDAMAELGADRLVAMARDLAMQGVGGKSEALRASGSGDPRAEMALALYGLRDGVPASQLPPIELVRESELVEGAYFEIAGQGFAVYERGGSLRASSGGAHDFNLEAVGAVPIDAGTYDADARVRPGAVRGEIPF